MANEQRSSNKREVGVFSSAVLQVVLTFMKVLKVSVEMTPEELDTFLCQFVTAALQAGKTYLAEEGKTSETQRTKAEVAHIYKIRKLCQIIVLDQIHKGRLPEPSGNLLALVDLTHEELSPPVEATVTGEATVEPTRPSEPPRKPEIDPGIELLNYSATEDSESFKDNLGDLLENFLDGDVSPDTETIPESLLGYDQLKSVFDFTVRRVPVMPVQLKDAKYLAIGMVIGSAFKINVAIDDVIFTNWTGVMRTIRHEPDDEKSKAKGIVHQIKLIPWNEGSYGRSWFHQDGQGDKAKVFFVLEGGAIQYVSKAAYYTQLARKRKA